MSDSVGYHRQQPTRLPHPWDYPGKNTGVGCYFLLQCMKVESEREVTQSCLTLRDPMDCSPPGSSIHGIFQARVLQWGAIAFSDNTFIFKSVQFDKTQHTHIPVKPAPQKTMSTSITPKGFILSMPSFHPNSHHQKPTDLSGEIRYIVYSFI